ncbi:hypothetical protein I3842_01G107400 [Carya illinoinensis]|uniref:Uncharacterized protein n=1 Tax=Carya illinoinensis TaxID=32201 RepID=A0A922K4R7_CARIL|nr:hypothetical protein I3842_01G107400 [Carya illinoinensis]
MELNLVYSCNIFLKIRQIQQLLKSYTSLQTILLS